MPAFASPKGGLQKSTISSRIHFFLPRAQASISEQGSHPVYSRRGKGVTERGDQHSCMNKDQSPVQWTLPRWAEDLIRETIELDSRSGAFDHALSLKRKPMKSITIHRLSLQFDGGRITQGSNQEQAEQAVELINGV